MAGKKQKIEKLAQKGKWKSVAAFLKDSDPDIRVAAMEAIGLSGDTAYAQQVALSLSDPVPAVRKAAALSLSRIGTGREIEQIRYKMENEHDEGVCAAYHEALKNAKGGKDEKVVYNPSKY